MQSPFLEEDVDIREVEMGLRVAEDEKRDAVEQEYEEEALASDDPDEELDEIDHTTSRARDGAPEVQAIHFTGPPADL
jgi:hypothetical protein